MLQSGSSGLPVGKLSNEDIEYIQNSEEFFIDPSLPAFKYFRVYVTESGVGSPFAHIMEFPIWGCPEGNEFSYSTLFLPDTTCIDTISASPKILNFPINN